MKANEAPKKIYLHIRPNKEIGSTWHGNKISDTDIEYTRTDAFIEKAYEYLSYHLDTRKIDVNYKFDFIEEFRKYIKGE